MGLGGTGAAFHAQPFVGTHGNGNVNFTVGSSQRGLRNRFFPQAFFLGEPWLAGYPDAGSAEIPQVIVVQQPTTPPTESKEEPKAGTPLLIQLEGDHYVRYGGAEPSANPGPSARSHAEFRTDGPGNRELKASVAELPAAVLVLRDGHQEEASNYAIYGGAIYINSNYWTSGAWTRKIQLADLDLPGTLKLNQERGVKFILPAGPNEVITRP